MTEPLVELSVEGSIATVTLARPGKHNAINQQFLDDLDDAVTRVQAGTRAIVLAARGEHFCSGLDLSELEERSPVGVLAHSQRWHRVFSKIEFGGIPVISALHGGVIGGGLELATATHVRVAEPDTFFQLPEGRHGIFVGGGASVRAARIIGAGRVCEMMLTNRRYDVEEGYALGLVHYRVDAGRSLAEAGRLAEVIIENAPTSNYAIVTALARISNMASDDGLFVESLTAALTATDEESRQRIAAFLHQRKRHEATTEARPE